MRKRLSEHLSYDADRHIFLDNCQVDGALVIPPGIGDDETYFSVHVPSALTTSALDDAVRQAGGIIITRAQNH